MSPISTVNVFASTMDEYKAILQRKRAAIEQMCQGLEEFLTIDIDTAIEAIEHPKAPSSPQAYSPTPWKPSQDDFMQACAKVEQLESVIEEARRGISKLSEDGPEASMGTALKMQLHYLEENLESAKRMRDTMQKAMEASEVTE